jgi:LPS sulfotransferase NodH
MIVWLGYENHTDGIEEWRYVEKCFDSEEKAAFWVEQLESTDEFWRSYYAMKVE